MTPTDKYFLAMREVWKPRDTRNVWQWAEDEISLSLRQTESPGPFSTTLTPYVREPLNCFADDRIGDLVLCWGTQTAKTNSIMVGTAWRGVNKPAPALWVMPSEDLAASFSDTRWMPMVEDCGPLAKMRHPNHRKFSKLSQDFQSWTLHFVGSNSPANLASRPISLLLADETDKFAAQRGGEASALHLAENRTKSFANPLRVKTSTPTSEDGAIWSEFLRTDQRYYYVPCPHCSEKLKLEWGHVKWDQEAKDAQGAWDLGRVRISAHYECPKCNGKIHDGHKSRMLRDGEWVATNPSAEPGRRGYHLNSLYAPWRSCGFGALAVKWLQAQNDRSLLQDFINSTLALPWNDVAEKIKDEAVWGLRHTYRVGTCPVEEPCLVLTVDPGQNQTHWTVAALTRQAEMHVVDYGTVMQLEDVLEVLRRSWLTPSGKQVRVVRGLVDSGDQTERVYRLCTMSPANQQLFPSRGVDAAGRPWSIERVNGWPTLILTKYSDYVAKCALYIDRVQKKLQPFLRIPEDAAQDFMHGLCGQMLTESKSTHRKAWRKVAHDHYGDCLKLALVANWCLQSEMQNAEAMEKLLADPV